MYEYKLVEVQKDLMDVEYCRNQEPGQLECTLAWVDQNYEWADGVCCLPRCVLYYHYQDYCRNQKYIPVGPATFGKLLRMRFPKLTTRRLGPRGKSKYHYYGISIKVTSVYYSDAYAAEVINEENLHGAHRRLCSPKKSGTLDVQQVPLTNAVFPKWTSSWKSSNSSKDVKVLPKFPNLKGVNYESEEVKETVETFMVMYRSHCQRILDTVISASLDEVRELLVEFWQSLPDHMVPLLNSELVRVLIPHCDALLYTTVNDVLVPNSCEENIPERLIDVVKNFVNNLIPWLGNALEVAPHEIKTVKLEGAYRFCRSMRRNLDFFHLAKATKGILLASAPSRTMHIELVGLDINAVWLDMSYLSLPGKVVKMTEALSKTWSRLVEMLSRHVTVEDLLEWLEGIIDTFVFQPAAGGWKTVGWDFILVWSYLTKAINRDLTLKSSPSFASFQVLHMMFDDFIQLVLESRMNSEVNKNIELDLNKFYQPFTYRSVSLSFTSHSISPSTDAEKSECGPICTCCRNQDPAQLECTLVWVDQNYEWSDAVCLPRCVLYYHYQDYCRHQKYIPVGPAAFGKVLRMRFPKLTTRRLGPRGQAKYHYYGIGIKESSIYYKDMFAGEVKTEEALYEEQGEEFSPNTSGTLDEQQVPVTKAVHLKQEIKSTPSQKSSNASKNGVVLPKFPDLKDVVFETEQVKEKVMTFMVKYRSHCQRILDTVISASLDEVRELMVDFWQSLPAHLLPLLSSELVRMLTSHCDVLLYTALNDVLVPNSSIQNIPESVIMDVKTFVNNLIPWLRGALEDAPHEIRTVKLEGADRFCRSMRRKLEFIHLAKATEGILIASSLDQSMHTELREVDINAIWLQLSYLSLPSRVVKWAEALSKTWSRLVEMLSRPVAVDDLLEWLEGIIDTFVFQTGATCWKTVAWEFILVWSYLTKAINRDLTLKSSPSFASFQVMHMMFDDYIHIVLERRVNAEINNKIELELHKFNQPYSYAEKLTRGPISICRNQDREQLECTLAWMDQNYEWSDGESCLPRCVLYSHYLDYCHLQNYIPVGPATFGKVLRTRFPKLTTRRLGPQGQSKYHYYGIGIKESSIYNKDVYTGRRRLRITKVKSVRMSRKFSPSKNGKVLPSFPDLNGIDCDNEAVNETVETFMVMYRSHCQRIMDTVISASLDEVRKLFVHFWQSMPDHMVPLLSSDLVRVLISHCDVLLYTALNDVLVPNSRVQNIPVSLIKDVKNLVNNLIPCLEKALENVPQEVRTVKLEGADRFCKAMRRKLSFIPLAKATEGILIANAINPTMHTELRGVDIDAVWMDLSYLSLPVKYVQWTEALSKTWTGLTEILSRPVAVEDLLEWLEGIIDTFVFQPAGQSWKTVGWEFILVWSYLTKAINRELTLNSSPSFASFQVLHMMFDDYIHIVLERRMNMEVNKQIQLQLNKFYQPFTSSVVIKRERSPTPPVSEPSSDLVASMVIKSECPPTPPDVESSSDMEDENRTSSPLCGPTPTKRGRRSPPPEYDGCDETGEDVEEVILEDDAEVDEGDRSSEIDGSRSSDVFSRQDEVGEGGDRSSEGFSRRDEVDDGGRSSEVFSRRDYRMSKVQQDHYLMPPSFSASPAGGQVYINSGGSDSRIIDQSFGSSRRKSRRFPS